MKKGLLLLTGLLLVGCQAVEEEVYEETVYPVETVRVVKQEKIEYVKYVGILQPEKLVEKTFSNVADIERIYVDEGDSVEVGDLLAKQDTSELEESKEEAADQVKSAEADEDAAYQDMIAAELEYKKAIEEQEGNKETLKQERDDAKAQMDEDEDEMDQAQTEFDQAKADYDAAVVVYDDAVAARDAADPGDPGYADLEAAVTAAETDMNQKEVIMDAKEEELNTKTAEYNQSRIAYEAADAEYTAAVEDDVSTDVEIAEAEYEASKSRYEAAQSQTSMARNQYDRVNEQIKDSYMYSNIDGYVLVLTTEEGETANPLVPVMVLGSSDTVVTIGLSQDNVRKVKQGMGASVKINDLEFDGEVLHINKIPDTSSRTYETDIAFPEDVFDFFIGESAVVNINVGSKEGIWIPIGVIQNDGEDYVYIIKDERVVKKVVITSHIDNDYVMVEGLNPVDLLVVNGMKGIKPGYLVNITNGDE